MKEFVLSFAILSIAYCSLNAQSLVGTWKTIDDGTKEPKSHIEITETAGVFSGRITKFLRANADPKRLCTACTDSRKNQPIMGMTILSGLRAKSKTEWQSGKILDPEKGQEYKCTVWFEKGNSDVLYVRGYHWSGLWRTQTWYRVN